MASKKHYIPFLLLPLLAAGCSDVTQAERNRQEAEREGAALLERARKALKGGNYEKARQYIVDIRSDYPLALDARRRGILLLDSIELAAAQDSVGFVKGECWERLNIKAQFYQRKLQEDTKSYGERETEDY